MALNFKILICVVVLTSCYPVQVKAETLVVSFGYHNAAPYTFIEDRKLKGGIYKDIMDEVGKALDVKVIYKEAPKKRQESYLLKGKRHVLVLTNPSWQKHSKLYSWSIPIAEETSIFVVSAKRAFSIRSFEDLHGKYLGTILGYQHPGLSDKFKRKEIVRRDMKRLTDCFNLLDAGGIDCLIGSDIQIAYYLKKNKARRLFRIAEKTAASNLLSTALSSHSPISVEQLNTVYQQLNSSGRFVEIFNKYK